MARRYKSITLFDILKITDEEIVDIARSYVFANGVRCPYCKSNNVVKFGKLRYNLQRYYCKECKRTFNDLTGTPLEGIHDLRGTILIAYLKFELKCSNYSISKALGIPYSTVRENINKIIKYPNFFKKIFQMLQKGHNIE